MHFSSTSEVSLILDISQPHTLTYQDYYQYSTMADEDGFKIKGAAERSEVCPNCLAGKTGFSRILLDRQDLETYHVELDLRPFLDRFCLIMEPGAGAAYEL